MSIVIYVISIAVITTVFYMLRKFTPIRICAMCAGVAGTWIWSLIARYFGYPINETLTAMLMGGTVVGILYRLEKRAGGNIHVFKKTFFIISGFSAVYGLIQYEWGIFMTGLIGAIIIYIFFGSVGYTLVKSDKTLAIEKEMNENCCD